MEQVLVQFNEVENISYSLTLISAVDIEIDLEPQLIVEKLSNITYNNAIPYVKTENAAEGLTVTIG